MEPVPANHFLFSYFFIPNPELYEIKIGKPVYPGYHNIEIKLFCIFQGNAFDAVG